MATGSVRAERALVTRRRMVRAAQALFAEKGYAGTTISGVAKSAGVAVPTVYYTFGTKAALLGEALGAAVVGLERWQEPPPEPVDIVALLPWHPWWTEFLAAPTSSAALDIYIVNSVDILRRVAPLVPALLGSTGDPEAADVVRLGEERRVATFREVIRIVAGKPGGLRPGLSEADATDIVLVLFSAELYQSLAGRGWTYARSVSFLREVLAGQLFDPR